MHATPSPSAARPAPMDAHLARRSALRDRAPALVVTLGAVMLLPPAPMSVSAQSDLTIEVGASQIGPALDGGGEDARFAMVGLRGSHYATGGSGVFGSVLAGHAFGGSGEGGFLSGVLEGRLVDRWSPALEASLDARLLGFGVEDPFPYRAFAAEGGPTIKFVTPRFSLAVSGLAGYGESRIELWRVRGGATRLFTNELWRGGGTAELSLGPPRFQLGIVGGWHRTPSGTYASVGARVLLAGEWGVTELRADRWVTPFDTEVVAGLTLVVPLGSWSLRGFFGRTDPDPLTLAQPGGSSGGVLVGRTLLSSAAAAEASVYEVVRYDDASSRVRFTVAPPVDADSVQLLGDFSLWEPIEMERDGDGWTVEIDVRDGTHHFGFLVDDEWYLPDDAPDVVPDEWGRRSATLVIEGASR